jgi:hypothetical protein
MKQCTIKGAVPATGYLHVKYGPQKIDGIILGPYDIVIVPNDERGSVAFQLPQGVRARIEFYREKNFPMEQLKVVRVPQSDTAVLSSLPDAWLENS